MDLDEYERKFEQIKSNIKDDIYELYETECPKCGQTRYIHRVVWRDREQKSIEYECPKCTEGRQKYLEKEPGKEDIKKVEDINSRDISNWYPTKELYYPTGTRFNERRKGNDDMTELFTHRNLIAISMLWNEIQNLPDGDIKDLMKFTFTGSLHLGSKMLPARKSAGGPVWPEPVYWTPDDFWEQNVWNNFQTRYKRVKRGKEETNNELSHYKEAGDVDDLLNSDANILWLQGDALEELREIDENVADYVFADPTYGKSIQYGELSYFWLSWLSFGEEYLQDLIKNEVVINEQQEKRIDQYYNMLYNIFKEVGRVAERDSYMTATFHNPDFEIRNILERACYVAGYDLEQVVWQPPASVPSSKSHIHPYGSVKGDFYFRFQNTKNPDRDRTEDVETFRRVVLEAARETVAERGEPTPMNIVTNSIEPALIEHGYPMASDASVEDVILNEDEFILYNKDGGEVNKNRVQKLEDKTLWFRDPEDYLLDRVPLNERVEKAVHGLLIRERKVEFTDIMKELYTTFKNSLTPEPKSVKNILNEYADKEGGQWVVKHSTRNNETRHSRIIGKLAESGHNQSYDVWIGRPEQNDTYKDEPLRNLCDFRELTLPNISENSMERIRNIDVLWIKDREIVASFEVESTTGIIRADITNLFSGRIRTPREAGN